ncbi:hypothetical protein PF1162 [Pyrococcus furiosus DSM 3638]|uniref:Uncharacterized protein n=1 Tax=Pyrococcus furiosus (strain ATCC 43587 / DSM 3638 / JCM 8422 / Vc1) TaxID=186497 RepID=Q8U1P3_PYRFU|nr:hypothetical protein PF1162 [Pyrococcus furiosus DSM 3638]
MVPGLCRLICGQLLDECPSSQITTQVTWQRLTKLKDVGYSSFHILLWSRASIIHDIIKTKASIMAMVTPLLVPNAIGIGPIIITPPASTSVSPSPEKAERRLPKNTSINPTKMRTMPDIIRSSPLMFEGKNRGFKILYPLLLFDANNPRFR